MIKMLTVWSILLIFFTPEFHSFNLDADNVMVYLDPFKFNKVPLKQSSYFGYSIILYGGSETDAPWIQIGAPRGLKGNLNTGVVFRCEIQNVCRLIDISERIGKGKLFYKSKKDGAWIGGAMDIDEGSNRFVVCGHRWTQISRTRHNDYWMQGACYWSHINESSFQELVPLQEKTKAIYQNAYYYGQGSAGISAQFTHSKIQPELLLGAPGVRNWAGTSIIYRDSFSQLPVASRQIRIRDKENYYSDTDEFSTVNIADGTQTNIFDLFGYSVASGYFFNKNELLYVTSAPKSLKYYGQILVYKFANDTEQLLVVKDTKRGQQFGEYFGSSITVGDINNDGLDDVIVGAPYHASVKYNEGRIYTFLGSPKGSLEVPEYSSVIDGKATNGHFGACVSFASDLDQDGFNDVVVGSPNENEGSGVIYIFKGSQNGLKSTPSQRIVGRDIVKEIRGFGISISKSVDIDNNRYYDIAVGAHLSGHVILFRSRPTVVIRHSLLSYENRLEYNTESFIINACYSFEGFSVDSSINITRTISADEQSRRAFLKDDKSKHIILHHGQILCENSTIKLKDNITNLLEPITVTLSHEFENVNAKNGTVYIGQVINGTDHFCPRCAVYDAYRSSKKHTVEIPFVLGCGEDNICDTNLKFETKLLSIWDNNTFVLGSEDFVKMQITVTNEGEKAYLTQVMIELSPAINFRSVPTNCVEQDTFNITCNIDNPLIENKTKTLYLDLDMKGANSGKYKEDVLINVTTLTSSQNRAANKKSIPLKLIRQADIVITGKSGQQSYSYEDTTFDKKEFSQIYQIEKIGASPISEVLIEIKIPKHFYIDSIPVEIMQFYQPEGYLSGQPIKCYSDNLFFTNERNENEAKNFEENAVATRMRIKRNVEEEQADFQLLSNQTLYINCSRKEVECVSIFCSTGPFKKRQNTAVLQTKFVFDIKKLKGLLDKKHIIVITTEGRAIIKDSNLNMEKAKLTNVSSIFVGNIQKNIIAWWIVTMSVIVGLLLLLLLIMALIKAGFFKRTTKMELEALKNAENNQDLIFPDAKEELESLDEELIFKSLSEMQKGTVQC